MSVRTATSTELANPTRQLTTSFAEPAADQMLSPLFRGGVARRVAVIPSLGAEAARMLSLVAGKVPAIPVVFLGTRKHFSESITNVYGLTNQLGDLTNQFGLISLVRTRRSPPRLRTEDPDGELHARDSDHCCEAIFRDLKDRGILGHPLVSQGFASIGCERRNRAERGFPESSAHAKRSEEMSER